MADIKTDVLPVQIGPAREATSDMPIVAPAKAEPPALSVSGNAADVEAGLAVAPPAQIQGTDAPAAPVQADPAAPAAEPSDAKTPAEPPKAARGVQKRLDELTAQRRVAEERAVKAEAELAEARKQQAEAAAAQPEGDAPRPKRAEFADPDEYDAALIEWSADKAARTAQAKAEKAMAAKAAEKAEQTHTATQTEVQAAQRAEFDAISATYQERRTKALETMPDYAEVAESSNVTISAPMAHAIMQAENGPNIAYHLGKNPDEAARIASLTPQQQFLEIGMLSGRLSVPKSATVSRTPAPIKPLGSTAAAAPKSADDESMAEYAARRNRELAASRKPFLPASGRPN